ncbi:MAG: ribonuclease HII [archaeon]|nr:ribonuclease HII [archaeon]
MIIAGIDEAGRGPVLGPMVIAVASIEKIEEEKLIELGVKDSKLLTQAQRNGFENEIKKLVSEYAFTKISPQEIDELRDRKSLNEIEAMRIGQLLNELKTKPEKVYVDSPDILANNFAKRIYNYLDFDCVIQAEHKADLNYPIVSAASIIAKIERDAEIEKLAKIHGKLGSGYPHDPDTISFLKNWVEKNKSLPDFSRKSWETSKNLLDAKLQKKLF